MTATNSPSNDLLTRVRNGNEMLGAAWLRAKVTTNDADYEKEFAIIEKWIPGLHDLCKKLMYPANHPGCLYKEGERKCDEPFVCFVCPKGNLK